MNAAEYARSARLSLQAAEKVRRDSPGTDVEQAEVEYHLRRADVFARCAQAVAMAQLAERPR